MRRKPRKTQPHTTYQTTPHIAAPHHTTSRHAHRHSNVQGTFGISVLFGIVPACMAWVQRYSAQDATGAPLDGLQPMRVGVALESAEGDRQFFLCP